MMSPLCEGTAPFIARRTMGVAALGRSIYYFGGIGAGGTGSVLDVSNDLWHFDTADLSWHPAPYSEPWPDARRGPGLTAHEDELLLWGGSGVARTADPLQNGRIRPFGGYCFIMLLLSTLMKSPLSTQFSRRNERSVPSIWASDRSLNRRAKGVCRSPAAYPAST